MRPFDLLALFHFPASISYHSVFDAGPISQLETPLRYVTGTGVDPFGSNGSLTI